ncbi:syntaxin-1A [Nephila pilipes]|uniref:Syntaxin-1A n=1 Tax=Nephila pilipes TaxID=299642 RepID=A0A8X6NS59_NEPPI|nr:syntaxin-1A [Nephila pilipes]
MEEKSRKLFARIEANIDELEEYISEIKKKHSKILSSPFHDEEDFHELDRLMAKVQSYCANTWSLLNVAKKTRQKDSVKRCSIRMETVQLNSLYQKFLDTVSDYSAAQASYRQRKKKLLKKQLEINPIRYLSKSIGLHKRYLAGLIEKCSSSLSRIPIRKK